MLFPDGGHFLFDFKENEKIIVPCEYCVYMRKNSNS